MAPYTAYSLRPSHDTLQPPALAPHLTLLTATGPRTIHYNLRLSHLILHCSQHPALARYITTSGSRTSPYTAHSIRLSHDTLQPPALAPHLTLLTASGSRNIPYNLQLPHVTLHCLQPPALAYHLPFSACRTCRPGHPDAIIHGKHKPASWSARLVLAQYSRDKPKQGPRFRASVTTQQECSSTRDLPPRQAPVTTSTRPAAGKTCVIDGRVQQREGRGGLVGNGPLETGDFHLCWRFAKLISRIEQGPEKGRKNASHVSYVTCTVRDTDPMFIYRPGPEVPAVLHQPDLFLSSSSAPILREDADDWRRSL
ncbi:hypothetical protein RRG08_066526 [Elysia crispata]|uniref:Uncharacterized protein n=1 Tax=Elysia crispata TaxID=231223 RepID=A0AAE1DII3_9GAST|nr:hypothetical protein RRG08_066526 [Elysia crispata]